MSQDSFDDLPDMDALARQMEDAMAEAQKAMQDLPMPVEGVMGSLATLMGNMPAQMEALGAALAGFGEQHEANVQSLAGDPDWSVQADIRVGTKLHLMVNAAFDLKKVKATWHSTQDETLEALVEGIVTENPVFADESEPELMGQVMEQLKQGRGIAVVESIEVLECHIQGAPGNAAAALQLSPQANIPLAMDQNGIGFEFAPLLTIRNRWERANVPTFSPMGQEIMVPLAQLEKGEAFTLAFTPAGQADEMTVTLNFQPSN